MTEDLGAEFPVDAAHETFIETITFLLKEYIEAQGLKKEGYIGTMERFRQDPHISEAIKADIERLRERIDVAEDLIFKLGEIP